MPSTLLIVNEFQKKISVENKLSATVSKAYSVSRGGLPSTYHAAQLNFHRGSDESKGSEHTVDGKPYPMEVGRKRHRSG